MIIPVGYAHVLLSFVGTGVPRGAAVTFGIQLVGTEFLQNRADDIRAAWQASIATRQSTAVLLSEVVIKAGPNEDGPRAVLGTSVPGTQTGECAPPQVAFLLRKGTPLGGRRNRGRMYVPGVPETIVDGSGNVTLAYRTAMQTEADEFLAALSTAGSPMVVLHSDSSEPTEVTSLVVDSRVATQRDRLR